MSRLTFPFEFAPSKTIFFEGLDMTGKSTQMERLARGCYTNDIGVSMWEPKPMFVHLPSGSTLLGQNVYEFTEKNKIKDPLARQMLHFASHREEYYTAIEPALDAGRSVFFDRGWWSAVAYCWFGNKSVREQIALEDFIVIAKLAMPVDPDVVFLFMNPYEKDKNNTPAVIEGFEYLATEYEDLVVRVDGSENRATTQMEICEHLTARGFYKNGS